MENISQEFGISTERPFCHIDRLLIVIINHHLIENLINQNKLIYRIFCPQRIGKNMFDVWIILVYIEVIDATSNVTSEVDIDLERWILDIYYSPQMERLHWSDSFVYVTMPIAFILFYFLFY